MIVIFQPSSKIIKIKMGEIVAIIRRISSLFSQKYEKSRDINVTFRNHEKVGKERRRGMSFAAIPNG
jgi:hypothetical protein